MRDLPHRSKMYILAGVLLAMLLGALDATIVGPALPSIVRELGGMQYLSWVFIIYSLASTIAIPIVGKLSDLYGRKYFYPTMPLFTISLQSQYPKRIGEATAAQQFFRSIGGTVGVALLGGVMNSVFARELTVLVRRDAASFGRAAARLSALAAEPASLLNAGALQTIAATMPPEAKPLLERFFVDVKEALATGISRTFFWGFILIGIAFIAMWFVREVPVVDHPHLDTASEIGAEILAEEAVQPPEHEPVIVGEPEVAASQS